MNAFEQSATEMKAVRDRLYALIQAATYQERKEARARFEPLLADVVRCLENFAILAATTTDIPPNLAELVSLTDDLRDSYEDLRQWKPVIPMPRTTI